jgi:hypothetical protein
MSNDGINRTNAFDKLVLEATSGETLGENMERMKAALHASMGDAPQQQPTQASSMPVSQTFACSREIHWHESTGRRPMTIRANTEADLDALENQILYGR